MSNDQPSESGDARRELYVSLLSRLCDEELPEKAQATGSAWPVRSGHCFRRLAYDAYAEENGE